MATDRGFVRSIEVGRAGLVTVTVLHVDDGSLHPYVIEDIDGDPERFNERLSKLGVLRDAMNRAEPVEIEHSPGKAGESIDRALRVSRDDLNPVKAGALQTYTGFILSLEVCSANALLAGGTEFPDFARLILISTDGALSDWLALSLQVPEREVAAQQLEMLRQAQTEGLMVRLVCGQGPTTADRIGVVAIDTGATGFDDGKSVCIDGFVESLGLLGPKGKVAMPGVACVGFISAPPFHGAGNVVESVHFKPQNYQFYVLQHSVAFELFEAGLRDNIRVRAMALLDQPVAPDKAPADGLNKGSFLRMMSDQNLKPLPKDGEVVVVVDQPQDPAGLVFGVELLAPLSSASRPVWICIWRESLDEGPEKPYCSQGALPSNDLTPQTLRDLHIPYTAVWRGLACFNSGVYQFELDLPHPFKIAVDGRDLCLHAAKEGRLRFAHACLHGCHEVTVTIEGWTCKDDFVMDVYRLR